MKNDMKYRLIKTILTAVAVLSLCFQASAQEKTVNGTVSDNLGAVIGATVMVKGTVKGVVTDESGGFSIDARVGDVLVISCIGYLEQEIKVSSETGFLEILLMEDSEELEQVVIVAYGQMRAKDFTGSVESIKVEDSPQARMGITDPTEFLRNNVPGLQITPSGSVGESSSMLVRGRKSIGSTTNEPLLVVDGMIYKGTLNDINPENIESIQVLKDASSLAAYGSQAAQGVIMITTKKGKKGKPVITFSTTQTLSTPTYKTKYMSPEDYIRVRNARNENYGNLDDTAFMTDIEFKNYMLGQTTDWYDLSTQTGHTQNYTVGIGGGFDSINYSVNIGHSNQQGVVVGNGFTRTNLSARLTTKINQYIEAGLTMDYSLSNRSGNTVTLSRANATPYGSPYFDETGRMRYYVDGAEAFSPLWGLGNGQEAENKRTVNNYNGFINIEVPWVKGLSYRLNLSYSTIRTDNRFFFHEEYYPSASSGNNEYGYTVLNLSQANGTITANNNHNWVMDHILTYDHDFGKNYFNVSLVYTRDSQKYEGQTITGSNFEEIGNTILGWYGLNQASNREINQGTYTLHNDVGYLARVVYSYDSRYHLNASVRRDGSSVFGNEHKWGTFPAVGLAWHVTNERFMEHFGNINDLKLKVSWGKNGSQTLAPYNTLSTIVLGTNEPAIVQSLDGSKSSIIYSQRVSAIGNPDLGWQSTESLNAGIEAAVLKRRISFEANYYYSKTTDQIFSRTIPIMGAGVSSQLATMGRVDNWGVEATLNTRNVETNDFNWTSQLTFNLNRNKLKALWSEDDEDDYTNERFIGKSLDVIWYYDSDGIVQETGSGSIPTAVAGTPNIIDQNDDGVLDRFDKVFLGNSRENFRMTFSNTLNYKNWQLYFMFTGMFGGSGFALDNNTFAYKSHNGFNYTNSFDMPYWTPDNKNNEYPAASYTGGDWRKYNSYGHVRLQDVSLSYNLSPLVQRLGISNARIYLSGHNLFYIAPYWKMSDPEARGGNYTLMRTVTMGVNFSF